MPSVDKLIVTNLTALRAKYNSAGIAAIRGAVKALIESDGRRRLATRLLDLADRREMRALGGRPVASVADERANKEAIDAAYRALAPDYLMILGAVDVVPHQGLRNPLYRPDPDGDDDHEAWSDLPYACDAPYGLRIEDFRGPTRVVGRLPDLTGAHEPSLLLRLLRVAAGYRTRGPEVYRSYFGLSAKMWRWSSAMSLRELTGTADALHLSPPDDEKWSDVKLAPRVHFINCHGEAGAPEFSGQATSKSKTVLAETSRWLQGRVSDGTVVAAECCFGAELYDPDKHHRRRGICYTYLDGGAYGYLGSSTISYGPSRGNARADLICRYFLAGVLAGCSLGRAALEARQKFVLDTGRLYPSELKTLAQFNLLGDPSIHPVAHVEQGLERTPLFKRAVAAAGPLPPGRKDRRDRLMRTGTMLVDTVGAARPARDLRPSARVRRVLTSAARHSGLRAERTRFMSFTVHDPSGRRFHRQAGSSRTRPAVHTLIGSQPRRDGGARQIVLISATVEKGKIVMLRRLHSR